MKKSYKALLLTSIFLFSMFAVGIQVSAKPEADPLDKTHIPFKGTWGACENPCPLGWINGVFIDGKLYAQVRTRQGTLFGTLSACYENGYINGKLWVYNPVVRAFKETENNEFDVYGTYWADFKTLYMKLSLTNDFVIPKWSCIWVDGTLLI